MFTIPWSGKLTTIKAVGDEGENTLRIQLVAAAEDALLQVDTVGSACRQSYKLVKGGKTGTIPVKMPAKRMCNMVLQWEDSSGKARKMKLAHVIPVKLAIVATSKETEPPKIRMDLNIEYTDKEILHILHAYKRQVTVDIHAADGKGVIIEQKKTSGNGKTKAKAKPDEAPATS